MFTFYLGQRVTKEIGLKQLKATQSIVVNIVETACIVEVDISEDLELENVVAVRRWDVMVGSLQSYSYITNTGPLIQLVQVAHLSKLYFLMFGLYPS